MSISRRIAEVVVQKEIGADDIIAALSSYNLLSLLPSIQKDIIKLASKKGDEDVIHIESPFPLDEQALARIRRIVGHDLAKTEVTINTELLAGFKARFKGKLYDGSAERIIKHLTNN
jgi:F0F1-type ATP synthase delta subunit